MKKRRGIKPPASARIRRAAHLSCAGYSYPKIARILEISKQSVSAWKRKYPKIWEKAVKEWPLIFTHKLGSVEINAKALMHVYLIEKKSLRWIRDNMNIPIGRSQRCLAYLAIPIRKDSVQVHLNLDAVLDMNWMVKKYESGASLLELSRATGMSIGTIRSRLVDAGVDIRDIASAKRVSSARAKGKGKIRRQTLIRLRVSELLYQEGHTLSEIAKAFGVTRQLIHHLTTHQEWSTPIKRRKGLGYIPVKKAAKLVEKMEKNKD